jgi:DnaJ-class molecular chaperone
MNEDARVRCEHCNGTGKFAGHACEKCGGNGYRLRVQDEPLKPRFDRPSRSRPKPK